MVDKMPQAAKLYFENWDVLDTARKELISVLEDFWPSTLPIIQELSEVEGLVINHVWENQASAGRWNLNGRNKAKRGVGKTPNRSMFMFTGMIAVSIADPRRSKNANVYCVGLRCSAANLQKLNKELPGSSDKLNALAKEHSLVLDWEDPRRLYERDIIVDPDNLTTTWGKVAEAAVELLKFVHKAEITLESETPA